MTTLLAAPMIDMPGWASALIALIVITLIMTFAVMFATYYERKIVARMQQRLGPTRTGPMGLLQPIADTFKLLTKEDLRPAIEQADKWMAELKVPVVIEVILERVTNIAMGTEIDNINEFEDLATSAADVPTALALLD